MLVFFFNNNILKTFLQLKILKKRKRENFEIIFPKRLWKTKTAVYTKNMYQALYRKYRPNTFDEVIGQNHITRTLSNQVMKGEISHAYLFSGSRGTGKTSVARIFARAVNCLSPVNGSPCYECEVCKALAETNNMDIIEIDAASNNRVDEDREIREKVKFLPTNGKYKVYIIDEVHMLTDSAFNALLKTLEEPPAHVVFILGTTEPYSNDCR